MLPKFIFEVVTKSGTHIRTVTSNNFILASHMACHGLHNITSVTFKGFK